MNNLLPTSINGGSGCVNAKKKKRDDSLPKGDDRAGLLQQRVNAIHLSLSTAVKTLQCIRVAFSSTHSGNTQHSSQLC